MSEFDFSGATCWERKAKALEAERDQLEQQVEKLLGAVEAHRAARDPEAEASLFEADKRLDQAADQVRKELEG